MSVGAKEIPKAAIHRILQRAGARFIGGAMIEEMRNLTMAYMEKIIEGAIAFVEIESRKVIKNEDIISTLRVMGLYLVVYESINSCVSARTAAPEKHKGYKGAKLFNSMEYHQRHSGYFAIPKANFQRLTLEVILEISEKIKFSETALNLFQLVVEDYLVKLCKKGYLCTLHADRETIQPRDLRLAMEIINLSL